MGEWTLDELAQRVARALAADGVRAPNARITAVPDGRIIRWYATTGLVDRPHGGRGRTARYGPRHLLQLVAIKRRQAQGCSLAQIQAELAGATDTMLRRVAAVPAELLDEVAAGEAAREAPVINDEPRRPAGAFWARRPVAALEPASDMLASDMPASDREVAATAPGTARVGGNHGRGAGGVLCGVQLGGDAVLLLPGVPHEGDLPAIRAAAGPLLDLLAERGLLARSTEGDRAT
jgi:DNA-binding transcriptional MerR regulator